MPSTNKKGPINVPPGIDSKNPAKEIGYGLTNVFENIDKFKNSLDPTHPSYQGNLPSKSKFGVLPGLDATKPIGINEGKDVVISSGGDSDKIDTKNNLIKTINEHKTPSTLYGGPRFNKLWKLYNKVKGIDGIENNPKYHKLIKKLSRKMPRTLKNLKSNIEKQSSMRKKKLGDMHGEKFAGGFDDNMSVQSNSEIYQSAVETAQNFLIDPYHKPLVNNSDKENEQQEIGSTQVDQDNTASMTGVNLNNKNGPIRSNLGTDISAALKNKKW